MTEDMLRMTKNMLIQSTRGATLESQFDWNSAFLDLNWVTHHGQLYYFVFRFSSH